MTIDTVIFDLDGTLIDSAPSILASIKAAFDELNIQPKQELSSALIGPPLMEVLASLTEKGDEAKLGLLAETFKQHYDGVGYKCAKAFDGVPLMLEELCVASINLFIATNKRLQPARNILKNLGLSGYFKGVYSLDYYSPPLSRKSDMLRRLLVDASLEERLSVYVGDRQEDAEAARACGLPFIMVSWGYGGWHAGHVQQVVTPNELLVKIIS